MRVLVGTLHSGENEYTACCESISSQTHPVAEHRVIEGLSASDAHKTLFQEFVSRAEEFDLLLKVDADMVLDRTTLLQELVDLFTEKPRLHHYHIGVMDWFTDRMIFGMNVYRNTVRWNFEESIFVEHPNLLRLCVNGTEQDFPSDGSIHDIEHLAPAAAHSPDPSPLQAFHFGLHKGVKVVEATANEWTQRLHYHANYIQQTFETYLKKRDRRLLLAAAGGELAVREQFPTSYASYTDPDAIALFTDMNSKSEGELRDLVDKLQRERKSESRSLQEFCLLRKNGILRHYGRKYLPDSLRSALMAPLIMGRGKDAK